MLADIFSFVVNTGATDRGSARGKVSRISCRCSEQITDVQARYERRKKRRNSLDFDDLLEKTLRMLKEHAEIAAFYQRQFQFILVDEYQDTNKLQSDFIDLLAAEHRNVMVVGDDAQSIYSWRGANFQNILDFPKRYPNAQVYKIETNYRSVPGDPRRRQRRHRGQRAAVQQRAARDPREATRRSRRWCRLNDGEQQAQFVAQRMLELREEGIELNEIAVLYRAHYHAMEVQTRTHAARHSVQITSGLRFFEQAHIKDVAAFLRFVANPRDEVAFKRMVRLLPGIGGKSAENLWRATGRNRSTRTQAHRSWASDCSRCRSAPAQKSRGSNWPIRWTRLRLAEPRSSRPR